MEDKYLTEPLNNWFDTVYYHILYKNRDDREAQIFIRSLIEFLNLPKESSILDLACGRGRHSRHLNDMGYSVLGIDISESSIGYAKSFENKKLKFLCHDMRIPTGKKFDVIVNLFTSFGYVISQEDEMAILTSMRDSLKKGGVIVIDYFNTNTVIKNIASQEVKSVEGIDFHLRRYIENGCVFKEIRFIHEGSDYFYKERVKLLQSSDFKKMFSRIGMKIINMFGDYKLNKFNPSRSPRLIMSIK